MRQRGFALPLVLITTSAMLIVMLALLQTVTSIRSLSLSQYYIKIAEEAAEAGATYATACLENNNRVQTWGSNASGGVAKPNLTQDTDCTGTDLGVAYSVLVASDNRIKTEFEVGNLDFSSGNSTQVNSVQVSAKGYARIKAGSTSAVARTYESTIKKTIVWNTSFEGQRSVSGTYRTCAIMSGSLYCWGRNARGQLGNGQYTGTNPENSSSADTTIPVKVVKQNGVLAGKIVSDLFSAQFHNCALADGKVYCWGYNVAGQLGVGNTTDSAVPVEVGGALSGKVVTAIGGSGDTSCAIAEGKIYCWGRNTYGTVGNASVTASFTTPQLVATGVGSNLPATYIATKLTTSGSRSNNMCAIADDQAYCWGENSEGSVGDNTITLRRQPTRVLQEAGILLNKKITAISQDGFTPGTNSLPHVCVVATDMDGANGKAYCWGDNVYGQLGINTSGGSAQSRKPVAVRTNVGDALYNKTVTDIAVGLNHSCALANGDVFCWGVNSSGQIGDNTTTQRNLPRAVSKLSGGLLNQTVTAIGSGSNRSCAIANSKTFCWGRNSEGQIGDGTLIDRDTPTESLFLRPNNNEYIY